MVEPGMALSFGGFGPTMTPLAFTRELIRQRIGDLTIIGLAEAWVADFLAGAGLLRSAQFSNFMFEGFGRCRNFCRAVETGAITVEDYSHFSQVSRFIAAGIGLPSMPVRTNLGSDIEHVSTLGDSKFKEMSDPFTGERLLFVPAVQPDICIVHAHRADPEANLQLLGAKACIEEQVKAARTVIATVEELVSTEYIRNNAETTLVPGFLVDVVVEVPWGAYPTGMYRLYDWDTEHLSHYVAASATVASFAEYLKKWVYAVPDHWAFLERVGLRRLMDLRADPYFGYRQPEPRESR